jgi:uncharacterized membrane-anchored protein YjiN (DUF445 family)
MVLMGAVSRPAETLDDAAGPALAAPALPRRNHVGTISLVCAIAGMVACRVGLAASDAPWLRLLGAGFEAATVGGLADWFAVTALFRHPLGIPIPHTAIIRERRAKIIESIVNVVENDWLSPGVIGARLARVAPSTLIVDWLRTPGHVERLGGPLRDLLRGVARMSTQDETVRFVEHAIERQLREIPLDATAGRWLADAVESASAATAFEALAGSLANLAARPSTAAELHWWIDRSADTLRAGGKRLVPFALRRKTVQRLLVEAACDYAAAELRSAASDPAHPLRRASLDALGRWAQRLADGDAAAHAQAERLRAALVESVETSEVVRDVLGRLRRELEAELADPRSDLAVLIDRGIHRGIVEALDDPERRESFDAWVRAMADDLLRRHHDQIGLTVRENLEALDPSRLVEMIESRVGNDLQFIRLNGAIVGGLVGVALAAAHMLLG